MFIRELLVYWLNYLLCFSIWSNILNYVAHIINSTFEVNNKHSHSYPTPISTKLISTDDDGDAFTNYDFYYDEKVWEEESSDKR